MKDMYFLIQFPWKIFFLNLEIQRSHYIKVRKLFKGGNYSRAETIRGNTVLTNSYGPDPKFLELTIRQSEGQGINEMVLSKLSLGRLHTLFCRLIC